jgi:hypothetical protein
LQAAAALIAAAASGGDPEIANKIIEKMMSGRREKHNTESKTSVPLWGEESIPGTESGTE